MFFFFFFLTAVISHFTQNFEKSPTQKTGVPVCCIYTRCLFALSLQEQKLQLGTGGQRWSKHLAALKWKLLFAWWNASEILLGGCKSGLSSEICFGFVWFCFLLFLLTNYKSNGISHDVEPTTCKRKTKTCWVDFNFFPLVIVLDTKKETVCTLKGHHWVFDILTRSKVTE